MLSTSVSPLIQAREELIQAPAGVSTCQCQSCGKFYPEGKNPDGYGKNRVVVCSYCDKSYVYPEARTLVRPDSWGLLDKDEVKNRTWYHATLLKGWKQKLDTDAFGTPLVHLGTYEASQDIARHYQRNNEEEIFLYSVMLADTTSVSDEFLVDKNSWDEYVEDEKWTDKSTVHRYVNDAESPGSISLLSPAGAFSVVSLTVL